MCEAGLLLTRCFFLLDIGVLYREVFVDDHFCINTHQGPKRSAPIGPSMKEGTGNMGPAQITCVLFRVKDLQNTFDLLGHIFRHLWKWALPP